ncbi:hypothetical protein FJ251_13540 [bacterium]|nr:hypothetical protein [bacterium]
MNLDSLLVLILIMTLPGLLRRLIGQKKAAPPPAGRRRPPREAPPPVAEAELPDWLQDLAEKLGAPAGDKPAAPAPPARTQRPRFEEEGLRDAEARPDAQEPERRLAEVGEWDLKPDADWQRFAAEEEQRRAAAVSQLRDWEQREAAAAAPLPLAAPAVTPPLRSPRHVVPLGRQGWRRAIVLAEVLGPPRALAPWREAGGR